MSKEGDVTNLRELHALRLNRADRLRPPMLERLRHRGLIRTLRAPIESEVRRLERHLHERIWAESMARNEHFAITLELKRLAIILTDQVAQARLREPNSRAQLGAEVPFQLLRVCVDRHRRCRPEVRDGGRRRLRALLTVSVHLGGPVCLRLWRFVRLCKGGQRGVKEGRGRGVDGTRNEHETVREYISCVTEHCVSVNTGVLEVNTC